MRPIPAYKAGLYGLTDTRQLSNSNATPAFIPVHRTGFSAYLNKPFRIVMPLIAYKKSSNLVRNVTGCIIRPAGTGGRLGQHARLSTILAKVNKIEQEARGVILEELEGLLM